MSKEAKHAIQLSAVSKEGQREHGCRAATEANDDGTLTNLKIRKLPAVPKEEQLLQLHSMQLPAVPKEEQLLQLNSMDKSTSTCTSQPDTCASGNWRPNLLPVHKRHKFASARQ